jgi:hypothetical protein
MYLVLLRVPYRTRYRQLGSHFLNPRVYHKFPVSQLLRLNEDTTLLVGSLLETQNRLRLFAAKPCLGARVANITVLLTLIYLYFIF